jgi:hypothetical protein
MRFCRKIGASLADDHGNSQRAGKHPVVTWVSGIYRKGIKLTKKAMQVYERRIKRLPGLERWFVDIPACPV